MPVGLITFVFFLPKIARIKQNICVRVYVCGYACLCRRRAAKTTKVTEGKGGKCEKWLFDELFKQHPHFSPGSILFGSLSLSSASSPGSILFALARFSASADCGYVCTSVCVVCWRLAHVQGHLCIHLYVSFFSHCSPTRTLRYTQPKSTAKLHTFCSVFWARFWHFHSHTVRF